MVSWAAVGPDIFFGMTHKGSTGLLPRLAPNCQRFLGGCRSTRSTQSMQSLLAIRRLLQHGESFDEDLSVICPQKGDLIWGKQILAGPVLTSALFWMLGGTPPFPPHHHFTQSRQSS